jgi:hypothetical protein
MGFWAGCLAFAANTREVFLYLMTFLHYGSRWWHGHPAHGTAFHGLEARATHVQDGYSNARDPLGEAQMMNRPGKQWQREAALAWFCVLAASMWNDAGAEVLKRSESAPVRRRADVVVAAADIAQLRVAQSVRLRYSLEPHP